MVDLNEYFGAKTIISAKSAKQEIKFLKKKANLKIKNKEIQEAIDIYKNAIVIATNWDLTDEIIEVEDLIRLSQIEGLKALKIIFENEANLAKNKYDYQTAAEKYNKASKVATEIFKLGVTEMTKEVKRLTMKSKELEKLI
jgi:23S rRNA-/tRNA-specific pseudouridylate synthase